MPWTIYTTKIFAELKWYESKFEHFGSVVFKISTVIEIDVRETHKCKVILEADLIVPPRPPLSRSDSRRWFRTTMMLTLKRRSSRWVFCASCIFATTYYVSLDGLVWSNHALLCTFKSTVVGPILGPGIVASHTHHLLTSPCTADWHHRQGPGWVYDCSARL